MKSNEWGKSKIFTTAGGGDDDANYSYLPDIFIKHTLKIEDTTLNYINVTAKGTFNKHSVGPAILWSPFFFAAFEYKKLTNKPIESHAHLFLVSIGVAALFWLFIGLYSLWKTLELLQISTPIISLTLIIITLGTNLFYYSFQGYLLSHLYSFSLLSVFLYSGMKYFQTRERFFLILMSISFGLSVITRFTSVFILFCLFPLIMNKRKQSNHAISDITISCSIIIIVLSIQSIAWYLQTEHWFIRTYSNEGFYYSHPQIINTLFSFQNGLFIYTPITLISFIGFFRLYKSNSIVFYCSMSAIILWVFLIASWWCWSYADGFEHRAFIDIYPVFSIGFANIFPNLKHQNKPHILNQKNKILYGIIMLFCLLATFFNLILTYQYCKKILNTNYMDFNCFKYYFLKTSDKYINSMGGQKDLLPYTKIPTQLVLATNLNFDNPGKGWNIKSPELLNGKKAIHFIGDEFGVLFEIPSDSIFGRGKQYYAKFILSRYEPKANCSSGVLLVNDIVRSNKEHDFYLAFKIDDYPSSSDGNNRTFHYELVTKGLVRKDSKMYFYIWNQNHQDFYLTGLSIELYRTFQ